MIWGFVLLAFLAGLFLGVLYSLKLRTRMALSEQELAHAKSLQESQEEHAEQMLQQQQRQNTLYVEELKRQHSEQISKAELQYQEALKKMEQRHSEEMQQQMLLIKSEMNIASEKILKERSEQLSVTNREQLSGILNPLQQNIAQMREAVEKSDREHNTTMQRLDATIKASIEQSREVGERADKLAQALTGENKTQGNFGELRLKQLLEDMGLEEGTQFELQETMRDQDGHPIYEEGGHRMIPDAILHFPDQRDVIIDSKMSFTAFEDYHNAETEEQRQDALHRHLASMKAHVNELSKKNYSKYIQKGHGRLDFVLMYVFSESALQLALANSPTLWKEAYDKGVVITGSQSLYMMLRVLEMTWRQVKQVENQHQIMQLANLMVDRVQLFAERMGEVRRQFDKTAEAFDKVEASTADSGQSIITTARQLLKMGAAENSKRKKSLREPQTENENRQIEMENENIP